MDRQHVTPLIMSCSHECPSGTALRVMRRLCAIWRHPARVVRVLLALAGLLVVAACGDDDDTVTAPTTAPTTATTTAPLTTAGPTSIADASTKAGGEASELPGEPSDTGPADGDVLGVVGVSHDDVLNVRALPGNGQRVVATLSPVAGSVEATGRHRSLAGPPGSLWWEIRADGAAGWVNARFLAWLGETNDATAEILTLLGGRPTAGTMEQLGRTVAKSQAAPDDEVESRITLTVAPTAGDLGEVTYDVVGFPDDSVTGVRLHVFGEPSGNGGFVLRTVESTTLCARGATVTRLCL